MTTTVNDPSAAEWASASEHRTPGISIRPLASRSGEGRSFEFNVVKFEGPDFWSPRHRHNFDQIRIGLSGETGYGDRQRLKSRTIGYFPEGTWYGPQKVEETSIQAILQFDGASRCGYVGYDLLDQATQELRAAEGTFEKGMYTPYGGPKMDGYQASWERATGWEMKYPDRRFVDPLYMNTDAFHWLPRPDHAGVEHKLLGVFGERGLRIEMLRLSAGSSTLLDAPGRTVVGFVLSGGVEVDGGTSAEWSAFVAEDTGSLPLASAGQAELIVISLPRFDTP